MSSGASHPCLLATRPSLSATVAEAQPIKALQLQRRARRVMIIPEDVGMELGAVPTTEKARHIERLGACLPWRAFLEHGTASFV